MPTYEYRCKECGEHLEVVQSFTDDPLTECPDCEGQLKKVFNSVGISFKGSGFYKNDSRSARRSRRRRPPRRRRVRRRRLGLVVLERRPDRRPARRPDRPARRQRPRRAAASKAARPRPVGDRRRSPRRRGAGRHRRLRRLGPLLPARRRRGGHGRHALRAAGGAGHDRRGRRPAGRVPAPPRARPHAAAPPGALPGQRLGAAQLGRAGDLRPVRLGVAAARHAPGRVRRARPDRRPHLGPGIVVPRRAGQPRGLLAGRPPELRRPLRRGLRKVAIEACRAEGVTVHEGGTVVVIEGPRFSTRAESRWYGAQGWQVINMTQMPEAVAGRRAGHPLRVHRPRSPTTTRASRASRASSRSRWRRSSPRSTATPSWCARCCSGRSAPARRAVRRLSVTRRRRASGDGVAGGA